MISETLTVLDLIAYTVYETLSVISTLGSYCIYLIVPIVKYTYTMLSYLFFLLFSIRSFLFIVFPVYCLLEMLNRHRYSKFISFIRSKERPRINIFSADRSEALDAYSKFMKKNIFHDNFFRLFTSYYSDSLMTGRRIRAVIEKYIFDIDPVESLDTANKIDLSPIPLTAVSAHRLINQTSRRFENMYIMMAPSLPLKTNTFVDCTDLANIPRYVTVFGMLKRYISRLRFDSLMKRKEYIRYEISENIHAWICKKIKNIKKDGSVRLVVLDIKSKDIDHISCSDKNTVYLEIRGVSGGLFGGLTSLIKQITSSNILKFNIDTIITDMSMLIDMFSECSITIQLAGISTILTPSIVDNYYEYITTIELIDPVFYPYSYDVMYRSIHNKTIDISDEHDLLYLLHKVHLLDLYFDKQCTDKQVNILFSDFISVVFTDDVDRFVDSELLKTMLQMYSNVNLDTDVI